MLFFSTPVLIRHLWQLKTVVLLHWRLICAFLLICIHCHQKEINWNLNWSCSEFKCFMIQLYNSFMKKQWKKRENGAETSFGQQTDCLWLRALWSDWAKKLAFGLLFKGPGEYFWKKSLTKGDILANFLLNNYLFDFYLNRRFQKWFEVDGLGFQIKLLIYKFSHFWLVDCFGYFFQEFGHFYKSSDW